ncbi:hypothetical protein SDC9_176700 [bioreactor metagenome]|uniref:Uncharacterized protein n=1 Tax=bioreactor metagenome TaxID=1076179 RepID=A0A645GU04_9ZZZZ
MGTHKAAGLVVYGVFHAGGSCQGSSAVVEQVRDRVSVMATGGGKRLVVGQ